MDIRREKLKRLGRCFVCLGPRHIARNCRAYDIECAQCGKRHYKTICNQQSTQTREVTIKPEVDTAQAQCSVSPGDCNDRAVLLQTATVWVDTTRQSQITRCLLDGGSQRSFIREDISKALNLPVVGTEIIKLHVFGSENAKRMTVKKVKASLRNLKTNVSVKVELLETPSVCSSNIKMANEEIRHTLEAKGFQVADHPVRGMEQEGLGILIGGDYYWNIVSGNTERLDNGLVAVESKFGWLIQGTVSIPVMNVTTETVDVNALHICVGEEQVLTEQLRSFWETESLGITDIKQNPETDALWKFEQSVKYLQGRYEVSLPWREENINLATNYCTARNRLNGLVKRFHNNNELYEQYDYVIQEYISEGIIEYVTNVETENPVYYLPHHPIIKESRSTTKLRIVFDASSHERESRSLNECLLTGPNLNPDLLSILIKFRQHRVAMMADITKAFLQIGLNERDRDVLRFLWFKERPTPYEEIKVVIMRMTRVPFGASASPFLLAATIRHHLKKYEERYPEEVKVLDECLYVDDFITGADDVENALKLSQRAKEMMSSASMKLCKWNTNSSELQNEWKQRNKDEILEIKGLNPLKVLGLTWNRVTDEFMFETNELIDFLQNKRDTKREVLQAAARIFDPIGFLSPFTIRVKCLFQEMWERGISWDEDLPSDLAQTWHQWCSEVPYLKRINISRRYDNDVEMKCNETSVNTTVEREIHVFTDASEKAYCAVAYLRCVKKNGECKTSLIASKTKVAPLKKMTLPRLELMGALIGARLGKFISNNLNVSENEMYFWTDSMITFHWIRSSSKQWKPFVENRVIEIQNLTLPENWKHCSGKENPADRGTRVMSAQALQKETFWWHGPEWLKDGLQTHDIESQTMKETDVMEYVVQKTMIDPDCKVAPLFDLNKYSGLNRVLRITSWIQRFVHNARTQEKRYGPLCTDEIQQAEQYWIKRTQSDSFSKEMDSLLKNDDVNRNSKIISLKPFLDECGILRVGGRLQETNWSFTQKHPYILPCNDVFSELLIRNAHEEVMHSGLQATLNQLREVYWILKSRQMTKSCVKRCLICKRARVKAGQQVCAPLPKERINEAQAFEITGVDFAGPIYVKPENKKAYIALFTCAVTRAVHLELVSDLTTDAFLLAFKRFIARRGICSVIYSDNAKTFKKAEKDLKSLWTLMNGKEIQELFANKRIRWKYIVERAAWWGGMWERLVRSVKTCLRKVLGRSYLNFEELQTLICEVEAVINSRPLSYLHTDSSEPSPLTPAHFLTGQRMTTLPSYPLHDSSLVKATAIHLNKRLQYRQLLTTQFWNRWKREYLMELRSAHHVSNTFKPSTFKIGDVVLIHDHKQLKHMWKMGRIEETFMGRDGEIRSCAVRLPSGSVYRRPVQLLYPLEVDKH